MTLIYFVLILGATIFVHEFGHFIFSKLFKVHVYEFSIGMGPKIWGFKRKNDETEYNIRLIPLGGYVRPAGEEEIDDHLPVEKTLQGKKVWQRFLIFVMGAGNNFIFALLLLFIVGLCFGSPITKPYLGTLNQDYPAYQAGLREGDLILAINDKKVNSWDQTLLTFQLETGQKMLFTVKTTDGTIKKIEVKPVSEKNEDETTYIYGIKATDQKEYGFISAVKYAFNKTISLIDTMVVVIKNLFTGHVSMNSLSGPVGIYGIVGTQAKAGLDSILYLVAFLSINVGFINLIPFPAFDGGHILFLMIEKIRGKAVDIKLENTINSIGFIVLMGLMIYVTFNDIIKLF